MPDLPPDDDPSIPQVDKFSFGEEQVRWQGASPLVPPKSALQERLGVLMAELKGSNSRRTLAEARKLLSPADRADPELAEFLSYFEGFFLEAHPGETLPPE